MNENNLERWEHGSDFSWEFYQNKDINKNQLFDKSLILGTGRCALKLLISWGKSQKNWNRIWVPTYFCSEVIESIVSTGLRTEFYLDDPNNIFNLDEIDFRIGDVILINNLFGYRSQPLYDSLPRNFIQIIEDHSHDPWSDWSLNSEADWCFASLRKSLPISDGAILWSPQGHLLPSQPQLTSIHYLASLEKYIGMLLKSNYLTGLSVDKEHFREFLINGEKQIGSSEISGITNFSKNQMYKIPINLIREKKNRNYNVLYNQIQSIELFQVLEPTRSHNSIPFSVILYFNSSRNRDFFYNSLIKNGIYPAILWPMKKGQINHYTSANIDFSSKMLSIHCDYRYTDADMNRVAQNIFDIAERK